MFQKCVDEHFKTQENHKKTLTYWTERIKVGDTFNRCNLELAKRLKKLHSMWGGHIGRIQAPDHRIKFTDDKKPLLKPTYLGDPMQCELDAEELQKMLKLNVIEPPTFQWAAPISVAETVKSIMFLCQLTTFKRCQSQRFVTDTKNGQIYRHKGNSKLILDCKPGHWKMTLHASDLH